MERKVSCDDGFLVVGNEESSTAVLFCTTSIR